MAPLPLADFSSALWPATKAMFRAFVFPDLGLRPPPWVLTPLLVAGVFLVVAGTLAGALGKGRFWVAVACAGAAGVAAWVLLGGRDQVSDFFVVISLILGFLGGLAFVVGFLRTPWIPLTLLLCIALAASGAVDAEVLGTGLAVASSVLGIWALYGKTESWSPGRRGSRWNQRSAIGWVICLLVSGMVPSGRLAGYGPRFKIAGMVIGGALLLLFPRAEVGAKAKSKS